MWFTVRYGPARAKPATPIGSLTLLNGQKIGRAHRAFSIARTFKVWRADLSSVGRWRRAKSPAARCRSSLRSPVALGQAHRGHHADHYRPDRPHPTGMLVIEATYDLSSMPPRGGSVFRRSVPRQDRLVRDLPGQGMAASSRCRISTTPPRCGGSSGPEHGRPIGSGAGRPPVSGRRPAAPLVLIGC